MGNNWQGEVSQPTDHTFEQFKEMKYGVRAAFIILRNYINRHKLNTIPKVIGRWAPSNENNTLLYIKAVEKFSMIGINETLRFENKCQMINLFRAMCIVENGREIDIQDVILGYEMVK